MKYTLPLGTPLKTTWEYIDHIRAIEELDCDKIYNLLPVDSNIDNILEAYIIGSLGNPAINGKKINLCILYVKTAWSDYYDNIPMAFMEYKVDYRGRIEEDFYKNKIKELAQFFLYEREPKEFKPLSEATNKPILIYNGFE